MIRRAPFPIAALAVLTVLLTGSARPFKSSVWLEKRARYVAEAERLKGVYTNCAAQATTPAKDVTVPVETFDDGSVKVLVQAKEAQYFLDQGLVWAKDVVVKKYDRDGELDTTLEAKTCVIDRFKKCGWAEGHAKVIHGKTTFDGNGIFFSSKDGYVRVTDRADIFSADLKFGGVRP